ncbi:hypothetical protein [Mycoplasma todarodis]|uniref:Uncharacterized protein n=1 Tax=Mycoplasma todarodis TaxID=1937191 RepID=A0A4R0XSV4_9MOLU|nr:hypothetical protein [Mycoplasma todarodis]TCG11972.1 hypothetical protein C4B25_00510 [Mycoplasma todarodis]
MYSGMEVNFAKIPYTRMLSEAIEDVVEYNLFWIFWRTGAWLTVPKQKRIVDSLLAIEVKKLIEYFSLIVMLEKDKNSYEEKVSVSYNNLLYTMKQKVVNQIGTTEGAMVIEEYLEKTENKKIEYKPLGLNKMVEKYAKKYRDLYEKLNYIQHHSLIPSAQTAYIKEEIFSKTKIMMHEVHEITKRLYIKDESKSKSFDELFKIITKYTG